MSRQLSKDIRGLFIAGTGTEVGKTVFTASLLHYLLKNGVKAKALKPVQTGVDASGPAVANSGDADVYARAVTSLPRLQASNYAFNLEQFSLPASPHLAAREESRALNVADIALRIRKFWADDNENCEFLLIESAGGLKTPISLTENMLDLALALNLPVALVCGNELGVLNSAQLALAAILDCGLKLACLVLNNCRATENIGFAQSAKIILEDNANFLRMLIKRIAPECLFLELAHEDKLDPLAWGRLSQELASLGMQIKSNLQGADLSKDRLSSKNSSLLERDKSVLWHPYASACNPPCVEAVKASHGNRIVLENGQELIDGMSSWWAAIHGYCHPKMLAALRMQSSILPHIMFGGLTHKPAIELAERLRMKMPKGLERVFFSDSGSVAVEVAMKMAIQCQKGRGEPSRTQFLTPLGGYHGDTIGAMSVCDPITGMHSLFQGILAQQIFMDRPNCRFDAPFDPEVMQNVEDLLEKHAKTLAAVIIEPIVQGAGGMWFYHPEYLKNLARLCKKYGLLLIFDEIATGFGRTGKFFASEWAGVAPDILCCGKALSGGMLSFAATACSLDVAQGICADGLPFMHGPTFMANPLACSVALASLDILESGEWTRQVAELENILAQGLKPCRAFSEVSDVRVLGAIGVVELEKPVDQDKLQKFFVQQGVWIRPFGRLIYLMPPYISPQEDVKKLCAAVVHAISAGHAVS